MRDRPFGPGPMNRPDGPRGGPTGVFARLAGGAFGGGPPGIEPPRRRGLMSEHDDRDGSWRSRREDDLPRLEVCKNGVGLHAVHVGFAC